MMNRISVPDRSGFRFTRRFFCFLLGLMMTVFLVLPVFAGAQESGQKIVRVGWFESSFCYWDTFGRRCGMDYEYQQKISAYTGWTYEYVEDSWPNLLQKLMDGDIDLLSDVSYKPERTEFISYPDLPMGTEVYYIYINAKNREISAEHPESFNGRRIGVNQGSVQEGFLQDWAEKNHLSIEVVPLTGSESESMDMVIRGQIDGFASIYSFSSEQKVVPVSRIGGSDYFYAVNRNRPDLLAELNMALSGIHEEDPYFIERLSEERQYSTRTNASLTPAEAEWLEKHGPVRVGYVADYLPFCQKNPTTGELTGALKDYLAHAENSLRNSDIRFEPIPYDTTDAALKALQAGEIDCAFPVHLSLYDAEQMNIRLTSPAMKTGMNAVLREGDSINLSRESSVTVAINDGNRNVDTFVMEQYPNCRRLFFKDYEACYEAVASGIADCTLMSNYRIPGAEAAIEKHKLYHVPTGEHIPLSFATGRNNRELYFLMNKTVLTTRSEDMDSALASYMHSDRKVSFTEFIKDNGILVLAFLTLVFFTIVSLLLQRLKAVRKAHEQQLLLEEAAQIAELKQTISSLLDNLPGMTCTKDAQTGVYLACNQAFADYAGKKDPSGVIGHTDLEIFSEDKAKQLAEDDRMALAMDEPYIFFEDVRDSAGNQRQIKTTKLKYTDATGRVCVLGIRQDVTDATRIRRIHAGTRESYEKARGTSFIYAHIAQALARGYTYLYYVDMITEEFIEYQTDSEGGSLSERRRGWHFFEQCQDDIEEEIYPEDREALKKAMDRKNLAAALKQNNSVVLTYRLLRDGNPAYVSMKVTRMQDDERYIVLGVMDMDDEMKQRATLMRVKEEHVAYNRLSALAGDFLHVYVTVPETGRYREITAASREAAGSRPAEGTDFFADFPEQCRDEIYPEDRERFLSAMTRENVLTEIERHGMFTLSYRMMMDGNPRYVQLKATLLEEKEGRRLIIGVNDIDTQVRQEEKYADHLAKAQIEANVDALTGVKNRHAYLMAEERLNNQLAEDPERKFAVVILDVNDLKRVNDTDGHKAGDQYLRDACRVICQTFKHSPVFRVGGDEFTVIAQGDDYNNIDELVRQMNERNEEAVRNGGIVIACGMARREEEPAVAPVFERADQKMYENKSNLKNR